MSNDPIEALDEVIRADHEQFVAEIREQADQAAARGDTVASRRHLARLARIDAIPKPWERKTA